MTAPAPGPGLADRVAPGGRGPAAAAGLVTATLAFFATLALALGLAAGRLAEEWSSGLAQAATLHVFAGDDAVEAQARAALEVLRTTPGIRSVRVIEVDEQRALLAPWFGADTALEALPLPLLIEVAADRDEVDRGRLADRLAAEAPGAVYDDHVSWRAPLVASAERLRLFAFASLAALGLALGAAAALAASATVAGHAQAARTLRLVGARDGFIAAAFTRRLTRAAAIGAGIGGALGLGLLALLPAGSEPGFFLVGVAPVGWRWLIPPLAPLAAAGVARAAVRLVARRQIRRWS